MYMMRMDDMIITGCKGSIITSSPQYLYVPDGSQVIVQCQNRSDDGETFYSYIITAVWYCYYDDRTNVTEFWKITHMSAFDS